MEQIEHYEELTNLLERQEHLNYVEGAVNRIKYFSAMGRIEIESPHPYDEINYLQIIESEVGPSQFDECLCRFRSELLEYVKERKQANLSLIQSYQIIKKDERQ